MPSRKTHLNYVCREGPWDWLRWRFSASIRFCLLIFFGPSLLARSKGIHFGTMSAQEIVKMAELHVYERSLYELPMRKPLLNGVLDARLVCRSN